MDIFSSRGLKRPFFTKPPALSVWRPRANGLVMLDAGDPIPSLWPVKIGSYWIFESGKRVPAFAGGSEMSNYLEDQIVAHIFRTGTFTKPTALGVGLWGVTLTDASTGATLGESTLGAYARVSRAPLDANWSATVGGDGHTDNVAALTFPTATANWNNQPCTDVGICDSITAGAGNLLLYSPLNVSKTVLNGDTASFAAGALDITFA